MNKGDRYYYARILKPLGIFEVIDMTIRTVTDEYFVGVEQRTRLAYLFPYTAIGRTVFQERADALEKVLTAEEEE